MPPAVTELAVKGEPSEECEAKDPTLPLPPPESIEAYTESPDRPIANIAGMRDARSEYFFFMRNE